ncbi:MAG: dipicolinate synthase subunit B [Ruminococcaceae bacterium]|nr:dipicolinate synthase subunit B [Oscillospiraceae bacterium]
MTEIKAGFAICGSFCTFSKVIPQMKNLKEKGIDVYPIMSEISYSTDTRFGRCADWNKEVEEICLKKIISTVKDAEPIGPKKMLDILIIAPCTGNTLAKLALGIADTSVTLATKAHLRNGKPVLIGVSTNDALGNAAKNIGSLMNYKNIFFIPMRQDDPENKPNSIVADFTQTYEAMKMALKYKQIQPMIIR